MKNNLYLLSQNINGGYDTYDSFVVVAESAEDAIKYHPDGSKTYSNRIRDWVSLDQINEIEVELIGVTDQPLGTVVISSFNAG